MHREMRPCQVFEPNISSVVTLITYYLIQLENHVQADFSFHDSDGINAILLHFKPESDVAAKT